MPPQRQAAREARPPAIDMEAGRAHEAEPFRPSFAQASSSFSLPRASYAPVDSSRQSARRVIFGLAALVFILGMVPAIYVLWFLIVPLVLFFLCSRRATTQDSTDWYQVVHLPPTASAQAAAGAVRGLSNARGGTYLPTLRILPDNRVLVVGAPADAISALDMQIGTLEQLLTSFSDYDMLLTQTGHHAPVGSAAAPHMGPPIDELLEQLPVHAYKRPTGSLLTAPAAASTSSGTSGSGSASSSGTDDTSLGKVPARAQQQSVQAASHEQALGIQVFSADDDCSQQALGRPHHSHEGLPPHACTHFPSAHDGCGASCSGDDSLVCAICLDSVTCGQQVVTLPCAHQFHAACVKPWLRQGGINALCPMCKTAVFRD